MSQPKDNDGGGWTTVSYKKKYKKKKNKKQDVSQNYGSHRDNSYQDNSKSYEHGTETYVIKKRYTKKEYKKKFSNMQPKQFCNVNKKNFQTGRRLAKIENDEGEMKHKTLRHSVKQAIVKARCAKKLKVDQLAQMINEKSKIITEYETGNPIPNNVILGKLERVLGIRLRGSNDNIGKPKNK